MAETWERSFTVGEREYTAVFMRRPFREGLEVRCELEGKTIRIAELGYGEIPLLELLRERIEEQLAVAQSVS